MAQFHQERLEEAENMQKEFDNEWEQQLKVLTDQFDGAQKKKDKTVCRQYTLCLKKVPTFKLSATLSNLNRFSKFLHCWQAYEICYKARVTVPTTPQACCYTTLGN